MIGATDHEEIKEATREWLRDVLRESGLTAYALAKRAGLAHTTVGRFLNRDVKYTLRASTIVRIMKATGIAAPPPVLLGAPADGADQELLTRAVAAALTFVEISADEDLAREVATAAAEVYAVLVEKGGDEATMAEAIDTLRLSYRHRHRPAHPRKR
jgi:hypothetical protein